MTYFFHSKIEVEKYIRGGKIDDLKETAYAWLIKFHLVHFNRIIEKELLVLSKKYTEGLLIMNELHPTAKLKKDEIKQFREDKLIIEQFAKQKDPKAYERFDSSAGIIISQACYRKSPYHRYNTVYLYFYYFIFVCANEFVNSIFSDHDSASIVVDAISFKILCEFISMYNDLINTKENNSIMNKMSERICNNNKLCFKDNEERNNTIMEVINNLAVGGKEIHDVRIFIYFWNQIISRNKFCSNYIIPLVNNILNGCTNGENYIDVTSLYTMDYETICSMSTEIVREDRKENATKAKATKVISTAMVFASIFLTYIKVK